MAEILGQALSVTLTVLLVAPIIGGLGFALIEKWWKCQLDFDAKKAMAQSEMMKAVAEHMQNADWMKRENPGKDE